MPREQSLNVFFILFYNFLLHFSLLFLSFLKNLVTEIFYLIRCFFKEYVYYLKYHLIEFPAELY